MFALLLPHGWSAASTGVPKMARRRSPFMDTAVATSDSSVAGGTSPARGDATSATSFAATSKVVSTSRRADTDAVAALAAVAASELEAAIRAARADQQKTSWQEHRPSRMRPAVIVEQEAHKRVVDTMAKGKTALTSTSTALRAKATEAAEALAARETRYAPGGAKYPRPRRHAIGGLPLACSSQRSYPRYPQAHTRTHTRTHSHAAHPRHWAFHFECRAAPVSRRGATRAAWPLTHRLVCEDTFT